MAAAIFDLPISLLSVLIGVPAVQHFQHGLVLLFKAAYFAKLHDPLVRIPVAFVEFVTTAQVATVGVKMNSTANVIVIFHNASPF
jgi:hypothetical protein